MKRATTQADVIERASDDKHFKAYGKNFKPLIAAGSWVISGFYYGSSKCGCCGRPIRHVLQLKNESHDVSKAFPEVIDIGIVCGPKVFLESCVGFYTDPEREWERQHRAWKDYINYVVLCVKNQDIWQRVPEEIRGAVDKYLEEGYKAAQHTGPWTLLKDAKKKYLKLHRTPGLMPIPWVMYSKTRTLIYAAKRLQLIPLGWRIDEQMNLIKDEAA